jgi:hypothetical protein
MHTYAIGVARADMRDATIMSARPGRVWHSGCVPQRACVSERAHAETRPGVPLAVACNLESSLWGTSGGALLTGGSLIEGSGTVAGVRAMANFGRLPGAGVPAGAEVSALARLGGGAIAMVWWRPGM